MITPTLTRKQRKRLRRTLRRRLTGWLQYRDDPCAYCQGTSTTVDHINARTFGGPDAPINRTGACARCNQLKGDTPVPLFIVQHGFPVRHPPIHAPRWMPAPQMRLSRTRQRKIRRAFKRLERMERRIRSDVCVVAHIDAGRSDGATGRFPSRLI